MNGDFLHILKGYELFRYKYAHGDKSIMSYLASFGQHPKAMVVACCDSRVDPALLLQCHPGELFVVRNVANIIPPYEADEAHHGTSAALEFGICHLNITDLIILGHSSCGGIQGLLDKRTIAHSDFIKHWVELAKTPTNGSNKDPDEYAKLALQQSGENALGFPWIKERVEKEELNIHLWFFDINKGEISSFNAHTNEYEPLAPEIE